VTWNKSVTDHADDQPPVQVFVFGGLTMWGWGARDDYTIASYLSKILHGKGYQVEVMNYGQMGYVNTQEIITLLRCLQRGEVPDIVLFYDGLNDVASSNHNREAGLSRNDSIRAEDFNFSQRMDDLTETWFHYFLAENLWGFYRLVLGLQSRLRPPQPPPEAWEISDAVVRQSVDIYEANLNLVASWGQSYGFDTLFYWQPSFFTKKKLTREEQLLLDTDLVALPRKAHELIYERVRKSESLASHPGFRDISAIFDDAEEAYFMDVNQHITEAGNHRVAEAMAVDVIELIERRSGARAASSSTEQ